MTLILIPQTSRALTEIPLEDRRAAPASQRIGVLTSQAYEGGPAQEIDLCSCVHCQMVFPFVKGSGTLRGWCMRCNGTTCGRPCCDVCVHWKQLLANMEAGLSWSQAKRHRPITVNVPCAVPASKGGLLLGKG